MKHTPALARLIDALRTLPGVGPKSAQRMAFHLLQRDRAGAARLGTALTRVLEAVKHCERCNSFSEEPVCALCRSPQRDGRQLCVVEIVFMSGSLGRSVAWGSIDEINGALCRGAG